MVYYEPEVAVKELMNRFNDLSLKKEVSIFLGHLPQDFPLYPFAALARPIASARREDFHFFDVAQRLNLPAVWLEYQEDRFSASNIDKIGLCKTYVFRGWGRNGGPKLDRCDVVRNLDLCLGKKMKEIVTDKGESLVDFHHRIHAHAFSNGDGHYLDLSLWLKHWGKADNYYRPYLTLFICYGILFEEFDDEVSADFRENIFLPAWQNVCRIFGVAPLIVRLPWDQSLGWYPAELQNFFMGFEFRI